MVVEAGFGMASMNRVVGNGKREDFHSLLSRFKFILLAIGAIKGFSRDLHENKAGQGLWKHLWD